VNLIGIPGTLASKDLHSATDPHAVQGLMSAVDLVPWIAITGTVAVTMSAWPLLGRSLRATIVGIWVVCALPSVAHRIYYSGLLLWTPQLGHEYADNRALIEVLKAIPVGGSVIAANDLRYPADDYARDNLQVQYTALFGHHFYLTNLAYERSPDVDRRRELQAKLREPVWSPDLEKIAHREGWTHLLIHKSYPHPGTIPWPVAAENATWAVYRVPEPTP
jgi:hypothetical protein